MWTLVSIVVLLIVWGLIWRVQPKLAFGVLLGLPIAWVCSRLMKPYVTGAELPPLWLPPLPFATVALTLFIFGAIVWLKADRLPPPRLRAAHGAYGAHGEHDAQGSHGAHASGADTAHSGLSGRAEHGDDLIVALELIRGFAENRLSAAEFVSAYPSVWRRLRDTNRLASVNPYLRRALNVVFDSIDERMHGHLLETQAAELRVRVATALSVVDHVA